VNRRDNPPAVQIPLLDLKAQLAPIRDEVHRAVLEVIDSTCYVMGPQVETFEERIAAYTGARHAIGVSSGTDAILVALMALDIQPGDVVVTTPYSFFASAGCIARVGAIPAFAEIETKTYNIDPEQLARFFATDPRADRVKAIIPVHLFGQCADMKPILELAAARSLPVIEDAAQALGARYPARSPGWGECGERTGCPEPLGKMAGTMGKMGCYSFFPSKNLGGVGDAGMVVTDDDALAEKLRILRVQGSKPKSHNSMIGGNFRLDPIQAAVLTVKLDHLDGWHRGRQKNATYYDEHFRSPAITKPQAVWGKSAHVYNQYVIAVNDRRDDLLNHLRAKRIGCEVYYPVPFHEQKCFSHLGLPLGSYPLSEWAARHTLALPIYPELTTEMQDYVVAAVEEFFA
jgi:dTDP-4-amino-4,6-dideoxygalactose transaminase